MLFVEDVKVDFFLTISGRAECKNNLVKYCYNYKKMVIHSKFSFKELTDFSL